MLENFNDFLSVISIVVILALMIFGVIKVFSKHHAFKTQLMESEYYQDDDTNDVSYDD